MSDFAFSSVKPFAQGQVNRLDVPWGDYLSAAFSEGATSNLGAAALHWAELFHDDTGEKLSPEQLQSEFPIEGVAWDRPFTRKQAATIQSRHHDEAANSFMLDQGTTGVARMGSRFISSLIGSMANPVDLALTMVPLFGPAAKASNLAEGASIAARAAQRMRTGLIASEHTLAEYGLRSKLGVRMLEGGLNNAMVEPFTAMDRIRGQFDYGEGDFARNVAMGAAAGGALHLLGVGIGKILDAVSPPTREAAAKAMLTDALRGRENLDTANALLRVDDNYWQVFRAQMDAKAQAEVEHAARLRNVEAEVRADFEKRGIKADDAQVKAEAERLHVTKQKFDEAAITYAETAREERPRKNLVDMSNEDIYDWLQTQRGIYQRRPSEALKQRINVAREELAQRAGKPEGTLWGNFGFLDEPTTPTVKPTESMTPEEFDSVKPPTPTDDTNRISEGAENGTNETPFDRYTKAKDAQEAQIQTEIQRIKSEMEASKPEVVAARTAELTQEALKARGISPEQAAKASTIDAQIKKAADDIQAAKSSIEVDEATAAGKVMSAELEVAKELEKQINAVYGDGGSKMRDLLLKLAPCVLKHG